MKKIIAIITLLFFCQILNAQNNIELKINGNKTVAAEQYLKWINQNNINLNDTNVYTTVKKNINEHLNDLGYFNSKITDIKIDTTNQKNALSITFNIIEGGRTRIKKISITPENKTDSLIYENNFKPLENKIFYRQELQNRIEKSLQYLENKGFPFASLKIQSLVFGYDKDSNSVVQVYLKIKTGKLSKIDKVKIIGNTKTKKSVIINTLRLQKGEVYSQQKIDEIPDLLNKLRFFEPVPKPDYYVNSKDEGILEITVKEKSTNNFDGILGYIPASKKNEKGYFTGFVNISLRNILGTGRAAGLKWQKENSVSQELELKYLEPWLFNFPFNLNLYLYQRKQDSTYVKRRYGGTLEYLATKNISASLIAENETVIPAINITEVSNSNSINTGLMFKLDYRNDILIPQKGIYLSTLYKFKSKNVNGSSDKINLQQYELNFAIYYSIFTNQVAAFNVHAKELQGKSFEESDYFRLGGANSLRGYREQQFFGNRVLWSNLEYRFLLSQSSYFFLLYDTGYFLRNGNKNLNIAKISEYKSAYGVGLSIDTALGIMRISYALASGNSFSDGLIHFGLLNEF